MISRKAMERVIAIKEKLAIPGKEAECAADIENMIEMKQSHLCRAEWGSCCGNICGLVPQINNEIRMLKNILEPLRAEDNRRAASLLEDYIAYLQANYKLWPDHW